MTRLIAIVLLSALAYLLFRYRTNEKLQKGAVIVLGSALLIYIASIVISELSR
ncbi:hypothetical protein [Vibrio marisflavi]|uniref:Uncharacterized protein n=1 Tax=Vibrio marisflavi CECT 7928 TaxID=634439 RepID=A0ABN8E414_9VIBR|nr:hypothetical protein [Vibrio marisflavi]CAH0539637.1 hypothetical protein VMF7928_02314 [Vibrio marisflavi CECT 7928]